MKTRPHTYLLHPLFLFSLVLLLLNDTLFKHEYHNWFTGKLSDFAGLFAFAVFIIAVFPSRKITVLIVISLVFIWWKSSLSEAFIFFINTRLYLPFHRTVDYSDYIALSILALAYFLKPIYYSPSLAKQVAIGCIGILSLTLFTADSLPRRLTSDNKVILGRTINTNKSEIYILQNMEKNGLQVKDDSAFDEYTLQRAYLRSQNDSGRVIYVPVNKLHEAIYIKPGGNVYKIPEMMVGSDTIKDVQFIIRELYNRTEVELRNFWHYSLNDSTAYYRANYLYRKLKKPIKRKFKELVK